MATISTSVIDGLHVLSHSLTVSEASHNHDFSIGSSMGRRLLTSHSNCDHDHGVLSFIKKLFDGNDHEDDSQLIIKISKNVKVLVAQEYPSLFIPSYNYSHHFWYLDSWNVLFESIPAPPPRHLA